jgi:cysteine synthase
MYRALVQGKPLWRALVLIGRLTVLVLSGLLLSTSQRLDGTWQDRRSAPQSPAGLAATAVPPAPTVPPTHQRQILEAYGKLPLRFEANAGQTDPQVQFLVRGSGSTLFLTATEAVLTMRGPEGTSPVRMQLVGANPTPHVRGEDVLPGTSNYFIGNDPQQWRTAVPNYAKVVYDEVYPGVDLVYYGTQGRVEHDFIVAPGASPSLIALEINGAGQVAIDAQGDLVVTNEAGEMRLQKPVLYQEVDGQRREIPSGYMLIAGSRVGFQVGAYDATKPLVIDPVLVYTTYLGGSSDDEGTRIAVDAAGQAYVTGVTNSPDFPVAGSPLQSSLRGNSDVFVAKLNPDGTALVYSTYLGGSGSDLGYAIAVDTAGNAYITGNTGSPDFPGTATSPIQAYISGGSDAFVAKLNTTGTALVYSTYLGGNAGEIGEAIAVDAAGNAYVAGFTESSNFPVVGNPLQATFGGLVDGFVAKLNASGTGLVYATYLGGSRIDDVHGIAVDTAGNAYVTGGTTSTDFPGTATSPIQAHNGGQDDGFVAKLNATGTALIYSTYLGGSGGDAGEAIAVDAAGNAYVAGFTPSPDFPMAGDPIQAHFGGSFDAFVAKLNATGTALVYSTYLGGSATDEGRGIAVDAAGNAYITGNTSSLDFPGAASSPIQAHNGGVRDAFVAKIAEAPTNRCPQGQGFWKNHPGLWPVTSLTLGRQTYTQAELLALFDTPPRGDASVILTHQLIAAKLNIASGSNPAPISSTIADADNLLSQFPGKLPYNVRTSAAIGQQMVNDANVLDRYNNGDLTSNCTP